MNKQRTKLEVYSKFIGHLRPVDKWNDGKMEEFKDRKDSQTIQINKMDIGTILLIVNLILHGIRGTPLFSYWWILLIYLIEFVLGIILYIIYHKKIKNNIFNGFK